MMRVGQIRGDSNPGEANKKEYLLSMGNSEITPWELLIAENIRSLLKTANRSDVRLLDIGCGAGKWDIFASEVLSNENKSNYMIVGFDISKMPILQAKDRQGKIPRGYIVADASSIPLTNNNFNLVIVIAVLHHLSNHEAFQRLIKEVKRVANDNAFLLFVENTIDNPLKNYFVKSYRKKFSSSDLHLHGFTSNELIDLLKTNDFEIRNHKYENLFVVYLCTALGFYGVTLPSRLISHLKRFEKILIQGGFWKYCATVHLIVKSLA
jgi:ubiquinone/menaquinone biosynthesis C-methylase UbiE